MPATCAVRNWVAGRREFDTCHATSCRQSKTRAFRGARGGCGITGGSGHRRCASRMAPESGEGNGGAGLRDPARFDARRIASRAPRSIAALCEISGIGEKKAERFGAGILGVIATVS